MDNDASPTTRMGTARGEDPVETIGHRDITGEVSVASPAEGGPGSDDFTSVAWNSSDDKPSTKDQAVQTMAPHMVNEMTQYSDPDDFGSDTDSGESTNSSQRPVLFASIGTRRRRLRVSDWLMPDQTATADSIQYTGNGHAGDRAARPDNDH